MKKFSRRLLLTLLALVGIVMLVVMFGISPFAKYYIEAHGKELIGRRVTVDELKINLLNGKLNIGDFTLYEADDTPPFVALDRFSTDVRLLALLGRKININYIDLVRPDIHIAQQGNGSDALIHNFAAGLHGTGLGALGQDDMLYTFFGFCFDFINRRHGTFLPYVLQYTMCVCALFLPR